MTKKILIIAFVIMIGVLAYLKFSKEDGWLCVNGQWVKHGNPETSMPATGCGDESVSDTDNTDTTNTDTSMTVSEDTNIIVDTPSSNELVSSPIPITGKARVFENQFAYRLKDSNGIVLTEGYDTADAPDIGQFGTFETEITFSSESEKGTLEVFSYSPKDGEEINKVTIPLRFQKKDEVSSSETQTEETMSIKVFFMNDKLDPEITCEKVFAVDRSIPKTKSVAKAAIEELLKGPSDAEKKSGYSTLINEGTTLNKITISDGTALADFSEKLQENTGGSCLVGLIRRQIEETLKQFSAVKKVIISINGNSEDILQP